MNTRLDTQIYDALQTRLKDQSMTELAKQVDVHKSSISRLVNGKVALLTQLSDTFEKLGIEFEVRVKDHVEG